MRTSIQLIPTRGRLIKITALEKAKKDLGELESKYKRYAKYMRAVLRVHSQWKAEINRLKEITSKQDNEIVNDQNSFGLSWQIQISIIFFVEWH